MTNLVSRYRHGTQVYDPPCLTEGATLYCFSVKADEAKMKASVDSFLNRAAPGKIEFEPLGDSVLFFFLRAPSLRSADPSRPSGYVEDYESAPSMPLLMKVKDGSGWDHSIVNWMPYVLISDPMGCIAGRELFGFLKGLGQFYIPTAPAGPLDLWQTRAQVFETLDPKELVQWKPLYTVRRTSHHDDPIDDFFDGVDAVLDVLKDLLLDWSPGLLTQIGFDLLQAILTRSFPVVNLKQFPSVEDSQKACFQEICTAPMKITKIRGGGRLKGQFEIDVPKYGSHDVAGDLGLPGSGPKWPVEMGLFIDIDFTVPVGKSIWKTP